MLYGKVISPTARDWWFVNKQHQSFDSFSQREQSLCSYEHRKFFQFSIVRVEGIEPSTSVLSGQRSTTELHTHNQKYTPKASPPIYQQNACFANKNTLKFESIFMIEILDNFNYLFPRNPPPPCGRSSIGRASLTVRLRPS